MSTVKVQKRNQQQPKIIAKPVPQLPTEVEEEEEEIPETKVKLEQDDQLSFISTYDTDRMIFSEPKEEAVPGTGITNQRVTITTRNPPNKEKPYETEGALVFETEELFTFGVQETFNLNQATGVKDILTGYQLPLSMYDMGGPTDAQKEWVDGMYAVFEHVKDHIFENKRKYRKVSRIESKNELRKMEPFYYKMDKKTDTRVEGAMPQLYAKLRTRRNQKKGQESKGPATFTIETRFYDQNDCPLVPLDLLNVRGKVKVMIQLESIYFGTNVSLQLKVREVTFTPVSSGLKPLRDRTPKVTQQLESSARTILYGADPQSENPESSGDQDETGSLNGEEETPVTPARASAQPAPAPPAPRKVIARKVIPVS